MVSLRKYLLGPGDGGADYSRILGLLLEGIALHTVNYDENDYRAFQNEIRDLGAQLIGSDKHGSDPILLTGRIIQTFESYNASVRKQFGASAVELREMVVLLTDVLRRCCRGNQRTVSSLSDVERQLYGVSQWEDLRGVKTKLEGCLTAVHAEMERQVLETTTTKTVLETAVAKPVVQAAIEGRGEDPVTGLPGRQLGTECLESALASKAPRFAAVYSLERWRTVVNRFGPEAGESYLLEASQTIAQKLRPGDQLFRWAGPSFLAVIERMGALGPVQSEVARIAGWRAEYTISTRDRAVLIPVSIASLCLPIWEAINNEALLERIDSFVMKVTA